MAAAQQYYEELKAPCVKGGEAWKERLETGDIQKGQTKSLGVLFS